MKKYLTNVLLTVFVLISACSSSDDSQGVISKNDLSNETTVTTIKEEVVQEIISPEDAQFLLARCLRDKGYDINDPKNGESLRSVIQPVFLATDQKGREELFDTIQTCAEENNIPLGDNADFENPEDVATIKYAEENLGDFKLKSSPDFVIPENQRMNVYKAVERLMQIKNFVIF